MTHVPLPRGFRAAGTYAGIKKPGRGFDLGVLIADEAYPAAAVFTQNALLGAHVHLCREHLAKNGGLVRAIVVNSGCANCATGQQGIDNARRTAEAVATRLGCPPEQVLPISTGASMLSSHCSGVSFQRTITPTAIMAISRPINGTNSALKYGGPTDNLAPVMASSTSG